MSIKKTSLTSLVSSSSIANRNLPTIQHFSTQLLNETATALQISVETAKILGISAKATEYHQAAIAFQYQDKDGNFINYSVFRVHNDYISLDNAGKKSGKYLNPTGEEKRFYYNGIHHYSIKSANQNTVILVEGQKKALSLCQKGLYALGVTGVNGIISTAVKDVADSQGYQKTLHHKVNSEFKELCQHKDFQNTIFFVDTDFRKHKNNQKRVNSFVAAIVAYQQSSNHCKKIPYLAALTDAVGAKAFDDIADDFIKNKVAEGLETLESNEYVTIWRLNDFSQKEITYLVSGKFKLNQYYSKTQYLSEDIDLQRNLCNEIAKTNNLLVRAATGKGKTHLIIGLIKNTFLDKTFNSEKRKIVLVFPTNSLLESLADLIKEGINKVVTVNGTMTNEEREYLSLRINGCEIVLTTYASYHKISRSLKANDMVFFDEFHNPLLNYEMSQFLFAYNNQTFCKKIHITATPVLEYNYCKNIDVFYISDKEIAPKKQIQLYHCEDTVKQSLCNYIDDLPKNAEDLHVVFYNDKETLKNLSILYAKDFDVQLWYSSPEIRKSKYYGKFLKTGLFVRESEIGQNSSNSNHKNNSNNKNKHNKNSNTNNKNNTNKNSNNNNNNNNNTKKQKPLLILATSFIYEGVSFMNTNMSSVAIFDEKNPLSITQALNRFRKADKNTLYSLFTKEQKKVVAKPFIRLFDIVNNLHLLNNGACDDENLRKEYLDLREAEYSFTDLYRDGQPCYRKLCQKYLNNNYSISEYLAIEFQVLPAIVYGTKADMPVLPIENTEEMEKKKDEALVILQDSIYKAAEVVVSTSDFTKLKKSLKKEFHAKPDARLQDKKEVGKHLSHYFLLRYQLRDLNLNVKEVEKTWLKSGTKKATRLIESLKVLRIFKNIGTGYNFNADIKERSEAQQINFIYQYVKENFKDKKFVQKDLISQTHEALLTHFKDMDKAKYYGLATQKKRTKLIIESLFDFKRCYSDAKVTYYNYSEIDYDTFLGENGIEKIGDIGKNS